MEKSLRKVAYTVNEACDATGLGRNFLYVAMSEGKLRSFKAGRRRLITTQALQAFVALMESYSAPNRKRNDG